MIYAINMYILTIYLKFRKYVLDECDYWPYVSDLVDIAESVWRYDIQ